MDQFEREASVGTVTERKELELKSAGDDEKCIKQLEASQELHLDQHQVVSNALDDVDVNESAER